jgi:cob(I)alamin adenosyltransferase
MIILFTGNGKGKTTAALGQAMRILGHKKSALIIQFIKSQNWKAGEDNFSKEFNIPKKYFEIHKMGLGFVGIMGDKIPINKHKKAAEQALKFFIKEKKNRKNFLIVLDEINIAVSLGLLTVKKVISAIKDFPEEKILVLTGRYAPKEFIDIADIATEMKELKHPFANGKIGKVTVEF